MKIWFSELDELQKIKVPRGLQRRGVVRLTSLHTFVDASQSAYGGVVYVRTEYEDKTVSVFIVTSKTKVVPLQSVSIPRLELMAAHLGNKLAQSIANVLSISKQQMIFWSDSTDVLWWVRGYSRIFKPFVANRIGEIQSSSNPEQWRYVPTKINPADHLTRGLKVSELIEKNSWWEGPEYLRSSESEWPTNKIFKRSEQVKSEVKKRYMHTEESFVTSVRTSSSSQCNEGWRLAPGHYSSWQRLIRVHAWVNRFINKLTVHYLKTSNHYN